VAYVLNQDQRMLKNTAAEFVKKQCPVSRLRELRDGGNPLGYSPEMWLQMAALGWPGIVIPEQYGGLGLGMMELSCVLEEFGRYLVPEPLLSASCLGAVPLVSGADEKRKDAWLPGLADGSLRVTCAYHERGSRYDAFTTATRAERGADGWELNGQKTLVLDGGGADGFIVSARTAGSTVDRDGITLFFVDADTPGVEVTLQPTVDLRNRALVTLRGVEVQDSAMLGEQGEGAEVLEQALRWATLGLAAEMLGNAEGAFAMTLEYLQTRKQFGVPIGSFQALKHRCAQLFTEIELTRSAVLGACHALDTAAPYTDAWISVAKARASDTAVLAGYEGIQMHGGIGMTDEHDIGFYAKRARASELSLGDAAYHRQRFAELSGF